MPWVLAAWLFLQAGTLWLNAALDQDSGEILLGRAVAVPQSATAFGYVALLLAVVFAFVGNGLSGYACSLCALLAILYSHPRTVWKGHPLLGPLVNGIGYGLLSTLAGWALVGVSPNARTVAVWLCGGSGILGCYFAVQAFQAEEDRARGYRTLVATQGPRAVLLAARCCIGLGELVGVILANIGWLPRLSLVALIFGVWIDRYLANWAKQPHGGDERWARGLATRLLIAALLGIGLAYVDYFVDLALQRPVAGLGTARGHPWK